MTTLSRWSLGEGKLNMRLEKAVVCGGKVTLRRGGSVSFDTYFNCLSEAVFVAKTSVREAYVFAEVEGAVRIEVYSSKRSGDGVADRLICRKDDVFVARRRVEVPFALSDGSFVWCKIIALSRTVTLFGGGYATEQTPVRQVNLAVCICTFKREDYVKRNVKTLCEYASQSGDAITVYVVDNGRTLTPGGVAGAVLLPNKNLGGSGGFARGMIEAYDAGVHTHFLLMDDDVSFDSEVVARTMRFLEYAVSENVAVGGGMLREDKPHILYEAGGCWDGDRLSGFYSNLDLYRKSNLLFDKADSPDYCAWWYCCMPIGVIDRHGLPLPLFIKSDDVEYGMRCKELEWTFLNGVGVFHSSFDAKYNASLEYYIRRNEPIINCYTTKRSGLRFFGKLVRIVGLQLVQQRYFAIPYILRGYDDFLKGADYLITLDAEKLNSSLRTGMPKVYAKAELENMGYALSDVYKSKPRSEFLQTITLNGYLIPERLCSKTSRRLRIIDSVDCQPRDFFMARRTLQYNPLSQTGFFTKERFSEVVKAGFLLAGKAVSMLFKYHGAKKSYLEAQACLTSFEFWQNKLGLNE